MNVRACVYCINYSKCPRDFYIQRKFTHSLCAIRSWKFQRHFLIAFHVGNIRCVCVCVLVLFCALCTGCTWTHRSLLLLLITHIVHIYILYICYESITTIIAIWIYSWNDSRRFCQSAERTHTAVTIIMLVAVVVVVVACLLSAADKKHKNKNCLFEACETILCKLI